MKQLIIIMLSLAIWLPSSAIDVTFQVDMSQQTVDPNGVHLAGSFGTDGLPEWQPDGIQLADQGGGIYAVTLSLTSGNTYEYKYLNGNAWGQDEGAIPAPCGVNTNRSWTVGSSAESIPVHCYASCDACLLPPPTYNITFQVDMTDETVDPTGVFVAGAFNGFSPTANPLTDQGAGIWSTTIALDEGTSYQYVYLNGSDFAGQESVPSACGVDNGFGGFNREVTVGTADETLDLHCFSSCNVCTPPTYNITFQVDMSNETVDPTGVFVAGAFNGFSPTANPLTDQGAGIWSTTIALDEGTSYQYVYLNGSDFAGEETVPSACGVDNGFGGFNREVTVGTADETLALHCFSSCDPCAAPPASYDITFQVDMSNETVDPLGVFVAGTFNGFSPTANPLTDQGAGIWSTTVALDEGTSYQYVYLNGSDFAGEETVPSACGVDNGFGGFNREVTVGTADETLALHCFSSCDPCAAPPASYDITFQVDMSNETVDPTGVFVAGAFNGFSPTANPLTDQGAGIWSTTIALDEGTSYQYVYLNGSDFAGQESVPSACGVDNGFGGFNREVTVGTADETLALHCFSSCNVCTPPTYNITFQVDMSNETVDPLGVFVAGAFNGFSPTANPLTDQGAGIWSTTIALDEGTSYQFVYLNGSDFAGQESVPSACGVDNGFGGFNREVTVGTADETLALHCFSSCDPCAAPPASYDITFQVEMDLEVVDPAGVYLAGSFNGFDPAATPMDDSDLDGIWTVTLNLVEGQTYQYKFLNGSTFDNAELVPSACGVDDGFGGFNREFTVGTANETLALVCYSSCAPCTFVNYNITFQVDMSDETVSPNGVHLIGSFNSFDPTVTTMTDIGGGIYEVVVPVLSGQTIEYQFVNGNTLAGAETVDVACSNGSGNREYFVTANEATLGPVCFGLCGSCPSNQVNVTFQVDMNLEATNPIGVFIVGSWQDPPFTAGLDLMADPELDDVWEITVSLDPGTVVEYKYLNGPNFAGEETVPSACGVDNGFGGFNRSFTVGSVDETIPLHCFSSCNPCGTPLVNVTLQVDMSEQTVDPAGVFVAGSFNGFSTTDTPLADQGGGIWSVTIPLEQGAVHQYVFLNGDSFAGQESVPGACGVDNGFGGFNRELSVGTSDQTEDLVCFSSCVICSPPTSEITFQVDMSLVTVDPAGVYLTGSFNGFSTTDTPLADQGGGIWSVTLTLDQGVSYEYKYLNGDSFAGEESVPSECGVDNGFGGFNRSITVGTADETIPLHCFSLCDVCPAPVNVTFSVDMSQETVDPNGVYLAGDFNSWDPLANPMTELGNGIWETTVLLDALNSFEYKFVNGQDLATQAESVPAECESNGNRLVNTSDTDILLPIVCFSQCQGCFINVTFQVDMFNETVPPVGVHIAGDFNAWDPAATPMNFQGYAIWTVSIPLERFTEYEYKFINGNAFGDDEDVPLACEQNWNRFFTTGGSDETRPIVCFGSCTLCDGCTDPFSTEFNPFAENDNGSCATPVVWGCTYADAENFDVAANVDDGSCTFELSNSSCPGDINGDGIINTGDLTALLGDFGTVCP